MASVDIVANGDDGVIDEHARTAPAHHLANHLALLAGIAVHRAALARGLVLAKPAVGEPLTGIVEQVGILLWQCGSVQTLTAVEPNHQFYDFFFFFDS